ncbi:MAG: nucleoside triphosphate pyrophosphohydrolase [Planctomycetota bacterium]
MSQARFPELENLIDVVARLRAPDGCPWDRKQTEATMAPHLLEEAYEAVDALGSGDVAHSREELGDVLMNVLMIAQIAGEASRYSLEHVARGIADKLVRRHPHVFGDAVAADADGALANWEAIKRNEGAGKPRGALAGLPADLPALLLAFRVGQKASRRGFDWPDARGPRAKVDEELTELDAALAAADREAATEELGDLLFSVANLARHAGLEPETALRAAVAKFRRRFEFVETQLGDRFPEADLEEMEALWERAKQTEAR